MIGGKPPVHRAHQVQTTSPWSSGCMHNAKQTKQITSLTLIDKTRGQRGIGEKGVGLREGRGGGCWGEMGRGVSEGLLVTSGGSAGQSSCYGSLVG